MAMMPVSATEDLMIFKRPYAMKKFYVFLIAVLGLSSCAQEVGRKTFVNVGNPLVRDNYTADPAPMVKTLCVLWT